MHTELKSRSPPIVPDRLHRPHWRHPSCTPLAVAQHGQVWDAPTPRQGQVLAHAVRHDIRQFAQPPQHDNYKWVALSVTTVGVVLATIDSSIMLIAMPDIFRGIKLDPLIPGNSFFLLWMILSFLVVSSVLVVSLGRLGDIFGRVRMYNLGFVIYTLSSLVLTVDWLTGRPGATYLIVGRVFQGVGAAFLVANSAAILTDAFPGTQRGLALGINNVAGISGMFIGLILGGILAPIDWRLVFLVSVPFGAFGTVWAYLMLREVGTHRRAPIDWLGNFTFASGLILIMVGISYGIQPYGGSDMGWTNPFVDTALVAGCLLLAAFAVTETRVANPMFKLQLFLIRPFSFGVLSSFLAAIARGGLMFMLIIWLQGIWLPEHGYSFASTPLWAGIYMLPLTARLPYRGPDLRLPLRPVRGSSVCHRRHDRSGNHVHAAAAHAHQFLLPVLCRDPPDERTVNGRVRGAEPGGRHEQPAGGRSRRRQWHEHDLPELRSGALDRRLLHPDDRGAGPSSLIHHDARTRGPRHSTGNRDAGQSSAAGVDPLRRVPRLQPDSASPAGQIPGTPQPRECVCADRPELFSEPDLEPVSLRASLRLHLRHGCVPSGGRCVVVERWPVRGGIALEGRKTDIRRRSVPNHTGLSRVGKQRAAKSQQ